MYHGNYGFAEKARSQSHLMELKYKKETQKRIEEISPNRT
jgi:hypothetical protein